jgi:hypothetical protein
MFPQDMYHQQQPPWMMNQFRYQQQGQQMGQGGQWHNPQSDPPTRFLPDELKINGKGSDADD